jgi:S-disulfanyl-L-cysteine oxidoreductase SoxD
MKFRSLLVIISVIILITVVNSCSGYPSLTTQASSTSTMQSTTSASSTPLITGTSQTSTSGSTFTTLSEAGKTVFASKCASCHGTNGEGGRGSTIIGSGVNLARYNTAKGLLDSISLTMPATAPGSLSHQEYLDVLCFILVQNNAVSGNTAFDETTLGSLILK